VAERGWSVVVIEVGLKGILQDRMPHTISLPEEDPPSLLMLRASRAPKAKQM